MPENKVQIIVEVDAKTGRAAIRQLGDDFDGVGRKGQKGFGQAASGADGLGTSLNQVTGLAAKLGLTLGALEISQAIVQGTIGMERLALGLRSATGSAEQSASELAFVREEANRLGLELLATGRGFVTIAAAAKGTALAGAGVRDIFSGIAEASAALSLSAPETQGALLAVSQMISKGKVSAEELRGQLGERLPGAFQIAARAMGVTTQELDKMLQQGEILATDFLPRFAVELHKTFGPNLETAAGRSEASFNRLKNSIVELEVAIGNSGLISFLAKTSEYAAKSIQGLAFLAKVPGTELKGMKLFGDDRARLKEFMNADLLTQQQMVAFEERRRAARAKSDANINGPSRTGAVLDDGALALEYRAANPVDDKALEKAKTFAEKMEAAHRQWENKADLAGLTGVEEQLARIGQEADELRRKYGNKGWIDAGQMKRENAAIQADFAKTSEQMAEARQAWESKAELAGLSGVEAQLARIGQEADELRRKFGEQDWISSGQAEAENGAIQADWLKRQKDDRAELLKVTENYNEALAAGLDEQGQALSRLKSQYDTHRQAVVAWGEAQIDAGNDAAEVMGRVFFALDQLDARQAEADEELKWRTGKLSEFQIQAFRNMESAGAGFLASMRAGNDDYLASFIDMTVKMADQWLAAQLMMAAVGEDFGKGGKLAGWLGTAVSAVGTYFGSGGMGTSGGFDPDAAGGLNGDFYGGGRANGGPVSAGKMYEVNERGTPELLITGGKQFLMMGPTSGAVVPATLSTSSTSTASAPAPVIHQTINIDARGAENGVEQRLRQAVEEGARKGYQLALADVRTRGPLYKGARA